jgi:hypothetical protein
MAGYLDHYGAGEEEREKLIKKLAAIVVVLLIAGGVLYYFFKNYREERLVKTFYELLVKQDYKPAYAMWGESTAYPFPEFMKDWGPQSGKATGSVAKSRSCGSGVIVTVTYPGKPEDKLWVERKNMTIGFAPFEGLCPGR